MSNIPTVMYGGPMPLDEQPRLPALPPIAPPGTSTGFALVRQPNIDEMTEHQRFALVKSLLATMGKEDLLRVQTLVDAHVETAK